MPNLDSPAVPLTSDALLQTLGGAPTAAGVAVTPESSLQMAAVYACVRLISEAIGSLPIHLYRHTGDYRVNADDHYYRPLLADEPNDGQDGGEFWREITAALLLRGNGYAYKEFNGAGRVTKLWPLPANRVRPIRDPISRELFYWVTLDPYQDTAGDLARNFAVVRPEEMLHFRALNPSGGLSGLSPIGLVRQNVGLALAAEEFGARFFGQDARPGGVIKVPTELSDTAFARMKSQWNALHAGVQRSHLMAILEGGAEWQSVGLNPDEAQFLLTRRFEVSEIARIYGVPPHLIGDTDRSTSWGTGIEQQTIGFVVYTLRPWVVREEKVTRRGLLQLADPNLYMKMSVDGLLRGDINSRYDAYVKGRQWGWLTANDVLRSEDMDPITDPAGEMYLNPLNFGPAGAPEAPGTIMQPPGPSEEPDDGGGPQPTADQS